MTPTITAFQWKMLYGEVTSSIWLTRIWHSASLNMFARGCYTGVRSPSVVPAMTDNSTSVEFGWNFVGWVSHTLSPLCNMTSPSAWTGFVILLLKIDQEIITMVCNRLASNFSIKELLLYCNLLKVDTSFSISYNDKFSMKIHFIYSFEYLAKNVVSKIVFAF